MITVIIHTRNSEKTLKRAIRSVVLWCSKVLVVDMESSDGSVKLAESLGADVVRVKNYGYVEPVRNLAISKAPQGWIFLLDADEEVPDGLAKELQRFASSEEPAVYFIPRKNMIFGSWAKGGWWPDYLPRFFMKGTVQWKNELHAQPNILAPTHQLPAVEELAIVHHNYETVEEFVDRMNRYTTIAASQPGERIFLRAGSEEFMRRYYHWNGAGEGTFGLSLALLQMVSEIVRSVKQWEHGGKQEDGQADSLEHEWERMYQGLCYWIADHHVKTEKSWIKRLYWMIRKKMKV